jgi:hypothetical protein
MLNFQPLTTLLVVLLIIQTAHSHTFANPIQSAHLHTFASSSPSFEHLLKTEKSHTLSHKSIKLKTSFSTLANIMSTETAATLTPPPRNPESESEFHDTIQRREGSTSNPASTTSETPSELLPTNLSPIMETITIGGLTFAVAAKEQVRTTTGALYTKAIRSTYDDDKKGKLDLLKLVQGKQQQPYVATSISVNDPEKLLNHYSLSKLNKECSRNLNKYDLLTSFTNIIFPISVGSGSLRTDASGAYVTHDLFSNTFQVTAQQVADSSRWYSGFTAPEARFQEDLEWSLAYFENNVDSALYARIHAKLLTYDERCRGGPLFFKLLNDETTTNSDANKKALITIVDTYKIRVSCKGERIPDVVDLFRSITDTVYALHDDSLPDEYVDKLIVIFTTTSVPDFNDLFDVLKKQLFAAQLQASIADSLIVPVEGSSSLTNNLLGAYYVLNYAGKAYYTLSQRGAWDKCLQQVPGESANVNPHSDTGGSSEVPSFEIKCFNCGGPHHLRLCPKPRDQATINKNRNTHPNGGTSKQPTGFRGNRPFVRPTKWRLPEEGEHGKRIIDNKPYTFNPTTKRWDADITPDSGQLPLAGVVPPTTPSAPPSIQIPTTPTQPPTDFKGAFFNGFYGSPTAQDKESQKQILARQMVQLKQAYEAL